MVKPPCDMDYLRLRATECGDCLEWQAAYVHDRYPVVTFRIPDASGKRKQRQFYVRHLVYQLKARKSVPKDGQHVISTSCENERCIAPAHVIVTTKSALSERAAQRGLYGGLEFRARVSAGVRHRRKLSDEGVNEIRTSEASVKTLAAKHGLSKRHTRRVRNGQERVDYSSPFAAARLLGAGA